MHYSRLYPISTGHYIMFCTVVSGKFSVLSYKLQHVVNECMMMFNCPSVEVAICKRKSKFLNIYDISDNLLCFIVQNALKVQT